MKFFEACLLLIFIFSCNLMAQQSAEDEAYRQRLEEWKKQKEAIEKQNQDKLNAKAAKEKFNAGNAFYRQADYAAAVKAFQESIALDAHFQKAYTNLGLAYRQLNDFSNALLNYDRALSITDGDKEVAMKTSEYKIKLLMDTKDFEMAIKTISFYRHDYPASVAVIYNLTCCYDSVGDYSKAFNEGLTGLKISEDAEMTAALNFELGEICRKNGRRAEAVQYYRQATVSLAWKASAEYQLKDLESK